MRRWAIAGATAALLAAFAVSGAMAGTHASGGVMIKATDKGTSYVINKSVTDSMYFTPGHRDGEVGADADLRCTTASPAGAAHDLDRRARRTCRRPRADEPTATICNQTAAGHLKNPKAPPGPTNDIAHWTVDKGKPGLDEPGDSIAIEGAKHKSISIKVTAPAGTTLHFICAVHPWMQGTIKVT